MYIYLTAYGKPRTRTGRWLEQDVSDMPLDELYQTYSELWLILTHSSFDDVLEPGEEPRKVSLNMSEVQTKLAWQTITVNQWLTQNANKTLPTIEGEVTLDNVAVMYRGVFEAGFDVSLVKPGKHPEAEYPRSEKTDLLLTKENVDYNELYKHVLVTVNGIIHQTSYSQYGLHVVDGAQSASISNKTTAGFINFNGVGSLRFIPFTDAMITGHSETAPLKEGAYIDLGEDLSNKTILLVLGGYLHALDKRTYRQVSPNAIRIDFRNYPLPQKLFELQEHIDLKSLDLTKYTKNDNLVEVGELYSDEKLRSFLKLPQSFAVVVDTDQLYVEKHQLEKTNLLGKWYSHIEAMYPLMKSNGKLEDYVAHEEEGVFVISAMSNREIRYYNFETTQWKNDPGIDNTKPTIDPFDWSQGFFLEIGKDL